MSIFVNIGMWFERFVIIASTLARDYIPSSWSYYTPTWVEIGLFIGVQMHRHIRQVKKQQLIN
jgi:Ni/Fe-hydrogenase subunit HybB-like protein